MKDIILILIIDQVLINQKRDLEIKKKKQMMIMIQIVKDIILILIIDLEDKKIEIEIKEDKKMTKIMHNFKLLLINNMWLLLLNQNQMVKKMKRR